MKILKIIGLLLVGFTIGYLIHQDGNATLRYGTTGFPKNCRAIIKANMEGYLTGAYTADEVLGSINRNCGEFGYSWYE